MAALSRIACRLPLSAKWYTILEAVAKTFSVVPDLPSWVQVETTNRCNFDCEMCPRAMMGLPDEDMDMETFQFVLDRLQLREGSLITLFGLGEPLMHGSLFSMVEEVRKRGLKTGFTTNGVLLSDEMQERIIQSGLDYLRISIDDDGMGAGGSVLHKASGHVIDRTRELVMRRGARKAPEILWNVVASTASAPSIPGLIHRAGEIGIDGVNIINLVPRFSTLTPVPDDRRIVLFPEWYAAGREHGVRIQSTFSDRFGLGRFFYAGRSICPQLLEYAYVTIDAKVTPCCHLPRLVLGDLREETLPEIWCNDSYKTFRKIYKTTETCRNCRLLTWR
jgi:MoaA/NifB/PqqE/SkfB family radical SAM enzyme